jgi:hypothetical protein
VKCKCKYISHDYNLTCPKCGGDLRPIRKDLGIFYNQPTMDLDSFFTGSSGLHPTIKVPDARPQPKSQEAELDLGDGGEDFEFTLDD